MPSHQITVEARWSAGRRGWPSPSRGRRSACRRRQRRCRDVAMAKVAVPRAATRALDRAIQVHSGAGITDVTPPRDHARLAPRHAIVRRPRRDPPPLDRACRTEAAPSPFRLIETTSPLRRSARSD
ncbi:acyl-CoA dehydrogenase family protein [Streptomyces misionensis]|uniref:acyl-CoA dehydrogenase family protein n=1 Tax=Streptomyces misionensis TaxID=67331 RepID=UPI0033FBD8D3